MNSQFDRLAHRNCFFWELEICRFPSLLEFLKFWESRKGCSFHFIILQSWQNSWQNSWQWLQMRVPKGPWKVVYCNIFVNWSNLIIFISHTMALACHGGSKCGSIIDPRSSAEADTAARLPSLRGLLNLVKHDNPQLQARITERWCLYTCFEQDKEYTEVRFAL